VKTLIIGLTGQTGAGKSTVAGILADKGFVIIDGDAIAREITSAGSPVLKTLAAEFGTDIIRDDGSLNRKLLGSRAFASRETTKRLNEITHPAITGIIIRITEEAEKKGEKAVVIDAAALLESGLAEMCDIVAVVTAPEKTRLNRIMKRDGLNREETLKRMFAQYGEDYYKDRADIVLRAYPSSKVETEVEKLISFIEKESI
jgi:dephospho-CoA kinase